MVEHDGQVGQLLKKLDDLGIADNTIVIYTTDNGAETFTWPDGGTTPFRGEKNTNWEGGYRVPAMVRWPGLVQPRTEINDIFSAEDWVPTLLAAAGEPDLKAKLLQGYNAGGKTFKVHLDGYDQRDLLRRQGPRQAPRVLLLDRRRRPRRPALRPIQGGVHGAAGPRPGGVDAADGPAARAQAVQPALRPVRARGTRGRRLRQMVRRALVRVGPGAGDRGAASDTFQEFPPRQKPGSFSVDQAMEKLMNQKGGN